MQNRHINITRSQTIEQCTYYLIVRDVKDSLRVLGLQAQFTPSPSALYLR